VAAVDPRAWVLAAAVVSSGAAVFAAAGPPAVEIKASRHGFRPATVNLRKGEGVRIVLTSADGEHCFAVDGLRIEKRIVPGRATTFDFAPDRLGTFPFYCCLESGRAAETERGELVVSE
jgi:heme/copper-type cytochrome/quinol oxidase subunit 2